MTAQRFTDFDPELDALYQDLADADLQPLWRLSGVLTPTPAPRTVPYRWRAAALRALGQRARQLVGAGEPGEQRVLSCANPGLGGAPYACPSLWAGVQFLGAGETGKPHRHTPAALRFVFEGSGVWTAIEGDPVVMSRGDLILTPSWTVHEHHNPSPDPMAWLDVLDVPLVTYLDSIFLEHTPDRAVGPHETSLSAAELRWGSGPGLVPVSRGIAADSARHSPLTVYRWADTDAALRRLGESVASDIRVRFTDPSSGRDVMPTMRCEMQRAPAQVSTSADRQTGSRIGAMLNGSGTVDIAGQAFDLEPGDVFVVPSWKWCVLTAGDADLDIFWVSDAPVLEATGLYRKEWAR